MTQQIMNHRLVALAFVMLCAEGSFASEVSCANWQFKAGAISNAAVSLRESNEWQNVRLPHDWSATGVFSPAGDPETAKLPWRGEAMYRYEFFCDASNSGKNVFFDFDGVMANPAVFINGQKAGQWDYGYCPFRIDATPFVRYDQTNTISVHVDTRKVKSRWYPGAGIIRPVRMVVTDPVHIAWNGIWIRTARLDEKKAGIAVQVNVENTTVNKSRVKVQLALFDPEGKPVDDSSERLTLQQKGTESASFDFSISKPQRWDIESPRLYKAVATVLRDGKPVDEQTTTFGLRTAQFDANKGFLLNGRRVQIKGVCLHKYDPFGGTLRATGTLAANNAFRFSTKYEDVESGLLYFGYRYYSPILGRWCNEDIIEEIGGINIYAYIHNSTLNHHDILGLIVDLSDEPNMEGLPPELREQYKKEAILLQEYCLNILLGLNNAPRATKLLECLDSSIRVKVIIRYGKSGGAGQVDDSKYISDGIIRLTISTPLKDDNRSFAKVFSHELLHVIASIYINRSKRECECVNNEEFIRIIHELEAAYKSTLNVDFIDFPPLKKRPSDKVRDTVMPQNK